MTRPLGCCSACMYDAIEVSETTITDEKIFWPGVRLW